MTEDTRLRESKNKDAGTAKYNSEICYDAFVFEMAFGREDFAARPRAYAACR